MPVSDFMVKGPKIDDEFRVRSIYCTLKLLHLLAENYEEIAESKLLFIPIKKHLDLLEVSKEKKSNLFVKLISFVVEKSLPILSLV